MKEIEDTILKHLTDTKQNGSNILDNQELIEYLAESKIVSAEIKKSLEENAVAQVEIEEARNQYTVVSERGSILYFVIKDLAGIDPMYQYSLTYFLRLFILII